jgi:hypothetical protein
MQTFTWGIKGQSGDRKVTASSKQEAITKILSMIGSEGFWIS